MITAALKSRLLEADQEVLGRTYAPYYRFRVGAVLLTEQGNLFSGANVENASYGLTLCAERATVAAAVAAEGPGLKVRALAVVSDATGACPPCGACLQVAGAKPPVDGRQQRLGTVNDKEITAFRVNSPFHQVCEEHGS